MTIAVHFRGPTLFVTRGATLDRVLIPDGRRTIFKNGVPDKHPDNDKTKRHYAGLLVLRGSGGEVGRFSLHGKLVTVSDGTAAACALDPSFNRTVPVHELTNGPDPARHLRLIRADDDDDYWERVAARVRLWGGTMRTVDPGPREFEFRFPATFNPRPPRPRRIPLLTTWHTEAPKVQIAIRDVRGIADPIEVALEPDESAYIYNHDKPRPSEREMIGDRTPCKPGAELEDHDFRWLYQLLDPPKGDWDDWLKGEKLPVPQTECPAESSAPGASPTSTTSDSEAKHPSVSTCFGGFWADTA